MLIFNARRVFKMRGIASAFSYLKKKGFSQATSGILANGRVSIIKIRYISELCLMLNCTPNDLFEWRDEPDRPLDAAHPLNDLRREKQIEFGELIKDLPLEKMGEVEDFLKNLKNQ